jgi:anti-anti-sigma regulatory factor
MATEATATATAHSAKLKIAKIVEGDIMCLRFIGTIDEDFNGAEVAEGVKGTLIVDLGEVQRISSFGIREWVDFVKAVEDKTHAIYFIECSPKIIDQFNMVGNFGGQGRILSFYAPYRCDYCDDDRRRLVQVDESHELIQNMNLPDVPCDSCGNPEYFDEDPESFFIYLATQPQVEPDAAVSNFLAAKLDYRVSDAARRLRVEKVVEEATFMRLAGDIDINFPREKLAEGLEGDVVVDMSAVGRVDDEGALEWTAFTQIASEQCRLYLRDCQPGFVEKAFTPQALAGQVEVLSFFMPFRCESCGYSGAQRVDVAEHYDVLKFATSPEFECPECSTPGPSIASDEFLAQLGNLVRPTASKELVQFAEEAHEKLLKPAAAAQPATMGIPVGEMPTTGRTVGLATVIAVLVTLGVVGVVGWWGYNRWQKEKAILDYDEGGRVVKQSDPDKAPWFAAWKKQLAEKKIPFGLADALAVQKEGDRIHVIGYSFAAPHKDEAENRAREAAKERLVHYLGEITRDESWRATIFGQYAPERKKQLKALADAIRKRDGLAMQRARKQVWDRRMKVAEALEATSAVYKKPQEQIFFQQLSIRKGDSSFTRYRFWVRLTLTEAELEKLASQYVEPVEVEKQKVTLLPFFPGLSWVYDKVSQAAVVLRVQADSPWSNAGLEVGSVITECAEIPIKGPAKFQEVTAQQVEYLKTTGGKLQCKTESPREARKVGYKIAKVEKPRPRIIYRGGGARRAGSAAGASDRNVWDDVTQ